MFVIKGYKNYSSPREKNSVSLCLYECYENTHLTAEDSKIIGCEYYTPDLSEEPHQ